MGALEPKAARGVLAKRGLMMLKLNNVQGRANGANEVQKCRRVEVMGIR